MLAGVLSDQWADDVDENEITGGGKEALKKASLLWTIVRGGVGGEEEDDRSS